MILSEFRAVLNEHSDSNFVFVFDDGDTIPADFHITEVGHVVKTFVDCGGEKRAAESCQLQVWVAANDPDHRLSAGKLSSILDMAREIVPSDDLPVEVEYEGCVISQYQVAGAEFREGAIRFSLVDKHTDCLAKEACGLEGSACCGNSVDKCC